jgi:hypothetical protein
VSHRSLYDRLKHAVALRVKGVLRRNAEFLFPSAEARTYREWISKRVELRSAHYVALPEPGLLSILTPVWDGSPVRYLRELADSIAKQDPGHGTEWVLLDNGCIRTAVVGCLQELSRFPGVRLIRLDANGGITRGLRFCLENASGRYILPVDADDVLYPDALRIVTTAITDARFPPLLYTDEDKVLGRRVYQPYFKPGWDPVLLLNSAYIAHLGVVDRRLALELGAYTDPNAEGSPDWDLFVRFLAAGHAAVHIPEVVYSWRVHARSTADDAASKSYIAASQRSVLERAKRAYQAGDKFTVEPSPLFAGGAHFRLARKPEGAVPHLRIKADPRDHPASLRGAAQSLEHENGFLAIVAAGLEIDPEPWQFEALGLFELHADAVMLGGRIRSRAGQILDAGQVFGLGGSCASPYRGRAMEDPGYFGALWKQRSVSAVSAQFCAIRARFFLGLLDELPPQATLAFLGAWVGAAALRQNQRVIYTPFLSGISDVPWNDLVSPEERELWLAQNGDLVPDARFYPKQFSLERPFALVEPACQLRREAAYPLRVAGAPARPNPEGSHPSR